ncbi:electron transfer flavoprotein subunit alpha/FixB family protein [Maribacter sp. 6B07]|uniref:electron transfer flavoprotein subunit alpha/FixB family protein n=1 Tax=Maribacter TaxID=252356 RepID=UPI00071996F5|nr:MULTISPECIES: electron transfer flavoprotein subunit alpha/FixB family protein [Maribacter]APA63617.1 electron transfer flavoprotein subunit alpha [Maribacter sp. 1_2014MBL_MicDiv]KSA12491.1 Electron transfer flavoprotein alpha subunit [Maribacter dokdonensis DSW-8]PHN91959.1 electron transfer flavoprotein subunit alpha/FixB family protein [Maribacter sp. 6B07]HAF79308.1 electron transfer flavoprotein subunit alpha/FixB family protein [Maribacter sp.]|tara:strand:- start:2935 stop:3903 length:969 start_codon:yes stop_codon:yes gene_type:complete
MSVLVYTESEKGKFKKNAFEVASYAAEVAKMMGTTVTAISFNSEENDSLGNYGVSKVLNVKDEALATFNAGAYATTIAEAVKSTDAKVVILSSSTDTKYLAPLLSAKLSAGYAPNVVQAPESTSPFMVKRTAFSNKGFAHTQIDTDIKIVGVSNNAFGAHENSTDVSVEEFSAATDGITNDTKSIEVDKVVGKATIADADIVVSAGRGLKGPENWGMIEELADVLGAATACSKPVSDLGWRPHGEHVGQTGKPVASNLYIAIGISGAIQHLAGVSASKTKVVINNDPEAPFFKAADYGIVGDAFEVVPQLIEKLKDFKAQNG